MSECSDSAVVGVYIASDIAVSLVRRLSRELIRGNIVDDIRIERCQQTIETILSASGDPVDTARRLLHESIQNYNTINFNYDGEKSVAANANSSNKVIVDHIREKGADNNCKNIDGNSTGSDSIPEKGNTEEKDPTNPGKSFPTSKDVIDPKQPSKSKASKPVNNNTPPSVSILEQLQVVAQVYNIGLLPLLVVVEFYKFVGVNPKETPQEIAVHKIMKLIDEKSYSTAIVTVVAVAKKCEIELELGGNEVEQIVRIIMSLLNRKQYETAFKLSTKLNLLHDIQVQQMIVPLLLYKNNFGEVKGSKLSAKVAEELVRWLDHAVFTKIQMHPAALPKVKTPAERAKHNMKFGKNLAKMAIDVVKQYNLSLDLCPTVTAKSYDAALQYLMVSYFKYGDILEENWIDLVESATRGNHRCRVEAVRLAMAFGGKRRLRSAAELALRFALPTRDIPYPLQEYLSDVRSGKTAPTQPPMAAADIPTFALKLADDCIFFIDTVPKFDLCVASLAECRVLGLDVEWRSTMVSFEHTFASLLQIAAADRAFVIDAKALRNADDQWRRLLETVLENDRIVKLGYAFCRTDIGLLRESISALQRMTVGSMQLIDLADMDAYLIKQHPLIFQPVDPKDGDKGLSGLVKRCFSLPLDKRPTIADWERRPLRRPQLVYAALDAHCLVDVYHCFRERCEAVGIDFAAVCAKVTPNATDKTGVKKPKKAFKGRPGEEKDFFSLVQQLLPHDDKKSATSTRIQDHSFKLIFDTNVQQLRIVRWLRAVGADVQVFNNVDDVAAQFSCDDKNILILVKQPFPKVLAGVKHHRPLAKTAALQTKEVLFYLKVVLCESDLFSRCLSCNGVEFISVTGWEMRQLIGEENTAGSRSEVSAGENRSIEAERDEETESNVDTILKKPDDSSDQFSSMWMSAINCNVVGGSERLLGGRQTANGARLRVDIVSPSSVRTTDIYYVCETCGHLFLVDQH